MKLSHWLISKVGRKLQVSRKILSYILAVVRVRLMKKIGLLDLTNQTQIYKRNGQKQRTKSVRDYCRIRIILHTPSAYYMHTNVNFLGVY